MKRKLHGPENYWSDNRCFSVYTKIATELRKRVMCPASAKAVNVLAVRYVKQGTEAAGFRAGSILHTLVNMLV